MPRTFRGETTHKVDQKGRVSVPASFRRVLEEGDPDWQPGGNPSFVLVFGFDDQPNLEGFTIEQADALAANIRRMPRSSPNRKRLQRRYQTKSVTLQVDENGRLVLPLKLREKVGITDGAVFAGMGDQFEIWSKEAYGADDADLAEDFTGEAGEENNESMFAELDLYREDGAGS